MRLWFQILKSKQQHVTVCVCLWFPTQNILGPAVHRAPGQRGQRHLPQEDQAQGGVDHPGRRHPRAVRRHGAAQAGEFLFAFLWGRGRAPQGSRGEVMYHTYMGVAQNLSRGGRSRGRLCIQSWCRLCIQSWGCLCIHCFLGSQA